MTLEQADRILRPFSMTISGPTASDLYIVRDAAGEVSAGASVRNTVVGALRAAYVMYGAYHHNRPIWRRIARSLVALGATPNPEAREQRRRRRRAR